MEKKGQELPHTKIKTGACFRCEGNHHHHENEKNSCFWRSVPDVALTLHHTYILDIIWGYCPVVAISGTLGYNNNVQPFLISAVLEKYKKHKHLRTWQKSFALLPKAGLNYGGLSQDKLTLPIWWFFFLTTSWAISILVKPISKLKCILKSG